MKLIFALCLTLTSFVFAVSAAEAQINYRDRDRTIAIGAHPRPPSDIRFDMPHHPRYGHPHGRPHKRHSNRPHYHKPVGMYRPQPLRPPRVVPMGGPECGDKGVFSEKHGVCVANEITRIDMPAEHKAYIKGCPGIMETRVIPRDGVMVEQQRCVFNESMQR